MAGFYSGRVLGIETSCDETAASVVEGAKVLSSIVSSQVEMHKKWGGIVPEAAARAHVESILPVLEEALCGTCPDAIAVTNRPGLVGALSVGVSAAKALALCHDVPFIGVHHLEGHLVSVLTAQTDTPVPHVALIASGGHTELVLVKKWMDYQVLGETLDDAAGEAFDKGARLLGLGYPGGKAVEELARNGDPKRYTLPRTLKGQTLNFSFSGLKTAALRLVENEGERLNKADAAASLQASIVDSLTSKCQNALELTGATALTLVGGVAANSVLRERLRDLCHRYGARFTSPPIEYCTDNAAMIALAGSLRLAAGDFSSFDLDCHPQSPLPPVPG
ncbi:MAG: tRNA (adenosine(37)-N6)-threonylcarbamoyltransferase complex transferase subunit TsaD [Chthonomonadaceae bacterium]|nr:tRNA (adenosine(37)-N6)-threonylcarbamoyltransferase complex transferase subunit TsaD [Chthonomonadaceae bacterium]